ncbi:MAG: hypothetical protein RL025_1007 [Bacteroidota bacterium]|mgnify:FL=1|jgi:multidrug efflux pump subunit AcrB
MSSFKEFKPTSWAIDNRITVFILTVIITLAGLSVYNSIPKEQFPEVVVPTFFVTTVYPGTSPADMENLVTRPLEKQLGTLSGVKKMTSNSQQDFANVVVEFGTDVSVSVAKQKVKDAVDKARTDLPKDLPQDPRVMELDISEVPILFVNISGPFDLDRLKKYATDLKDKIEDVKGINRVDMVGALDREIQVDVDMFKLQAANMTMDDIERTIRFENMTMSGGNINTGDKQRSIRILGEFQSVSELGNLVVTSMNGSSVFLKDIAKVTDGYKDKQSYARLNGQKVITLNVIKRSGENLIQASDDINALISEAKSILPSDLKITISGDQSRVTRTTVNDLTNSIIIGFVLVTLVLMFFMGTTNAMFVGLSVPVSSFLAFMFMPSLGFTMNMIVLFALLMALGVIVDDAIVVIENTHRLFDRGRRNIVTAAKMAAGEVFMPVLAGTLTTVAPFMPLAFWDGIVGKFMFFLPVTLILTLMSSLLVAYIINPVFAVQFMKPEPETPEEIQTQKTRSRRSLLIASAIFAVLGIILHLAGSTGLANFVLFIVPLLWINRIVLGPMIERFQNHTWPSVQDKYEQLLRWCLQGRRPAYMMLGTAGLLVLSFVLTGLSVNSGRVKIAFFPTGEPNFVYVYLNTPIGTRAEVTDSLTQLVETKVMDVLGPRNPLVESVVTNVAIGAGDPMDQDQSVAPHKGKVTVAFIAFGDRDGMRTLPLLDSIRARIKGIPGVEIAVDQERGGPPTGKPINIEVTGQDFKVLGQNAQALKTYLDSCNIAGVEELKIDLERSKPELLVRIDRERAQREGVSTAQIGSEIRSAVFGKEASKFRSNNDEIPIQLRYSRVDREDLNRLLNARITFRDMNAGGAVRQLPVSAVANIEYTSSLGSIKRKNEKRVVTLSSNVLSGFTPNQVVASINEALKGFEATEGTGIRMTGEQEEQAEAGSFLSNALMISVGLIFMILMFQFNSMNRTLMILSEILFSIIGVLLGYVITGMTMSIIMTGIGIVALAGIVVKNGILIVEFIDLIRKEQRIPLREAIVQAGKIRLAPVFLTAASTVLGLVPLALGLNIDFPGLFARFEPHLYLGGDQVAFFGPLSWTIIFGLTFSTLITLILLPAMYYIAERNTVRRRWFLRRVSRMAYR